MAGGKGARRGGSRSPCGEGGKAEEGCGGLCQTALARPRGRGGREAVTPGGCCLPPPGPVGHLCRAVSCEAAPMAMPRSRSAAVSVPAWGMEQGQLWHTPHTKTLALVCFSLRFLPAVGSRAQPCSSSLGERPAGQHLAEVFRPGCPKLRAGAET